MIGDGALLPRLKQRAQDLGVQSEIAFIGALPNYLPYVRRATAVVLPSRYEASEKLLVEALAVDTQVVSTNCPEAPLEVLESGRFGALVPVGDPIEIARFMENAVDDPFPTDVGRDRAMHYAAKASARRYAQLVEILCSQS